MNNPADQLWEGGDEISSAHMRMYAHAEPDRRRWTHEKKTQLGGQYVFAMLKVEPCQIDWTVDATFPAMALAGTSKRGSQGPPTACRIEKRVASMPCQRCCLARTPAREEREGCARTWCSGFGAQASEGS